MNELDVVLVWVASLVGGADCAICQALRNAFDNVLSLGIGAAGAAGAAAGTVAGGASSAYREARDQFNRSYDRASGGTDSSTAPPDSDWFTNRLQAASDRAGTQSPAPPSSPGNPWARAFSGSPWARAFSGTSPSTQMPAGTLKYFNVGAPTGPQVESQQ